MYFLLDYVQYDVLGTSDKCILTSLLCVGGVCLCSQSNVTTVQLRIGLVHVYLSIF